MTGPTRAPATLAADLAALSEQATPGEWEEAPFAGAFDSAVWMPERGNFGALFEFEPDARLAIALVNAHRAGHLVTLDAALDWVSEPQMKRAIKAALMEWLGEWWLIQDGDGSLLDERETKDRAEKIAGNLVPTIRHQLRLAALRDRAASPAPQPDTTHDTKEQP